MGFFSWLFSLTSTYYVPVSSKNTDLRLYTAYENFKNARVPRPVTSYNIYEILLEALSKRNRAATACRGKFDDYFEYLHKDYHEHRKNPKILTILYEKKNKLILGHVYGVITKHGDKKVLYVHLLCAWPREMNEDTKQSYGRILLEHMKKEARRFNVFAIQLYSVNKALKFYKKNIIQNNLEIGIGFRHGYISNNGNPVHTPEDWGNELIWVVPKMSNANRIRLAQNTMKIWPKNRHVATETTFITNRIQYALREIENAI